MSKRRFESDEDIGSPLKKTKTIDLTNSPPPRSRPLSIDLSTPPERNEIDISHDSPIDLISDDDEDKKSDNKREINKPWNSNQSRADRLLEDANGSELQFGQSPDIVDFPANRSSPEIFGPSRKPSSSSSNDKKPALNLFKPKSDKKKREVDIVYDSQEEDTNDDEKDEEELSPESTIRKLFKPLSVSEKKVEMDSDNESVPPTPPKEEQVFEKAFQEQKDIVDSHMNSPAVSEIEKQEYNSNQKRMQELKDNKKYRQQKMEEEAEQNAAPALWSSQQQENIDTEEVELKELESNNSNNNKKLQPAHESNTLPLYDANKDTFMKGESEIPVTKEYLAGLKWCSSELKVDELDTPALLRVYLTENPYANYSDNSSTEFKDIQDFVDREFERFRTAFGVYVFHEASVPFEGGDIVVSSTPDEMRFCGVDTKIFTTQEERRNIRKQRMYELDPNKRPMDKKSADFHLFRQIIPAETVLRCYVYSLAQECMGNAKMLTRAVMKQGIESKYPKLSRNLTQNSKPMKITTCLYPEVHGMPFHGPYWLGKPFHPTDNKSICMDNLWMMRHTDIKKDKIGANVIWAEQPDKDETQTNKIGMVLQTRKIILKKRELVLLTQAGKSKEEIQQKQQKTNQKKSEAQRDKKDQEKKQILKKKAKEGRMFDELGIDRKDSESDEEEEDDPATKTREAALQKQREEAEKAAAEFMKTL